MQNESLPGEEIDVGRGRRTLLALFAVALVPVLLAMVMYFAGVGVPEGRTNKGELLDPPLAERVREWQTVTGGREPALGPESGWKIIVTAAADCGPDCLARLEHVRQTRIALGREMSRVRVFFLLPEGAPEEPLQDWAAERFSNLELVRCQAERPCDLPARSGPVGVYLADPIGNVILHYPEKGDPRALLDDLKRLLKVSRVG